tara:strand:+ start:1861 stop:2061 length:201 start_codon:yes stop_codon:yes gene_type:complete
MSNPTFTIPHEADDISNAITKVINTRTTGTLSNDTLLVNSDVIKSYVDGALTINYDASTKTLTITN